MAKSFESAFHHRINRKLVDQALKIAEELGDGSAFVVGDTQKTAMEYSRLVGYRRALHDCIGFCVEVERDLLKD